MAQHLMSRGGANQAIEYVEHALVLKPDSQVGPFNTIPQLKLFLARTGNNLLFYFPRKLSFVEREIASFGLVGG